MLAAPWGCIYHASELVSYFSCHGFDFWFIFLCLLPVLRFWVCSLYLCLYFLCYGLEFLLCIFSFNFRVFSSCISSHFALPAFVLFPPLWLSDWPWLASPVSLTLSLCCVTHQPPSCHFSCVLVWLISGAFWTLSDLVCGFCFCPCRICLPVFGLIIWFWPTPACDLWAIPNNYIHLNLLCLKCQHPGTKPLFLKSLSQAVIVFRHSGALS